MTQLPPNRQFKKLWEIAKTQSGWTPSRANPNFWWWNIVWLKSWELNDNLNITEYTETITQAWVEWSSAKIFPKWTLIMAMYGATAWKLGILWMDATTNQAVCSIQNTKWLFDSKYIYYFLFKEREHIIRDSFWWAQPNISKSYIDDILIPLPPLPVQHKIVALLDEASAQITASKSAIQSQLDALDQLWQSSLSEVFENEEYELVRLNDICNKITDWSHNPPKWIEMSEYKMISSRNVDDGVLSFDNCRYLTKEDFDLENKRTDIQIWDILLSIVWTIGKVCVIEEQHWKFTMQRSLAVIKPKKELVNSYFLWKFFQSPILQKFINDNAKWAAQKWIYLNSLKELQIPLPDITTQTRIVSQVDDLSQNISSLRSQYKTQLQQFDELRASILDQAFKGELVEG